LSAKVMLVGDAGPFGGSTRNARSSVPGAAHGLHHIFGQPSQAQSAIQSLLGRAACPRLRPVALEHGAALHEAGDGIEHGYFPQRGLIWRVVVMRNGARVETTTVGRGGAVGPSAGLGSRCAFGRAVVQLPGAAASIPVSAFHAIADKNPAIRSLVVRYNDLLI